MEGSRLWPLDAAFRNHTKAFSSEVDTDSREENASKKYLAFSGDVDTGSREQNRANAGL
jgi:hypothetical protein